MMFQRKLLVFILVFPLMVLITTPFFSFKVKGVMTQSQSFYPSIASDNAFRRLTTDYYAHEAGGGLDAGCYSGTYYQYGGGMMFRNLVIPRNAIIVNANFTLKARASYSGVVTRTYIRGWDMDDATTFTSNKTEFDNRWQNENTTALVYWDNIPTWIAGNFYTSPNISSIIQEIVNRVGWTNGNNLTLFWDDFSDRSTHALRALREGHSFGSQPANCPKLSITWEIPTVFITFHNNTGGIFRVDNVTKTNGTSTEYANETVLELVSIPQNSSYGFSYFEWDSTNSTSNPHDLTIRSNLTMWCVFYLFTCPDSDVGVGAGGLPEQIAIRITSPLWRMWLQGDINIEGIILSAILIIAFLLILEGYHSIKKRAKKLKITDIKFST